MTAIAYDYADIRKRMLGELKARPQPTHLESPPVKPGAKYCATCKGKTWIDAIDVRTNVVTRFTCPACKPVCAPAAIICTPDLTPDLFDDNGVFSLPGVIYSPPCFCDGSGWIKEPMCPDQRCDCNPPFPRAFP